MWNKAVFLPSCAWVWAQLNTLLLICPGFICASLHHCWLTHIHCLWAGTDHPMSPCLATTCFHFAPSKEISHSSVLYCIYAGKGRISPHWSTIIHYWLNKWVIQLWEHLKRKAYMFSALSDQKAQCPVYSPCNILGSDTHIHVLCQDYTRWQYLSTTSRGLSP